MTLKMAKATEADLDAAMKICRALDAISGTWDQCMPAELCADPDLPDPFEIDDHNQCRRVLELLMELADCSRLNRVVLGMAVLLDPRNKIVHPDLDHLDFHPDIEAARKAAAGEVAA